jgi:hypothetical protein
MERLLLSRRAALKAAVGAVALTAATPATAAFAEHPDVGPFHGPESDHVLFWNGSPLLDAFRQFGGHPGPLSRGGAMMNLAIYDAVNSIQRIGKPYRTKIEKADGHHGALNAAVDWAAYEALKAAYPNLNFDDEFAAARALTPLANPSDERLGEEIGKATAAAIIQDRLNDGSTDTTPYTAILEPGHWRPHLPGHVGGPNWGRVRPFALLSPGQFAPPQFPYGYTTVQSFLASPEYAAGVHQVHRLGGYTSTERTADQTEIARYWANDLDGTYKPVGHQYVHALEIYKKYRPHGTSFDSARLFALTSIALADGAIAVWNSKYESSVDLWRPHHSIHRAYEDGNPATTEDPTWRPLSSNRTGDPLTPAFPAYTSGHTGIVAAWGGAMRAYFGTDSLSWSAGTDDPAAVGVVRSYTSISQSVQEKADSRLYAGVHFIWDNNNALELGAKVADYVVANSI